MSTPAYCPPCVLLPEVDVGASIAGLVHDVDARVSLEFPAVRSGL